MRTFVRFFCTPGIIVSAALILSACDTPQQGQNIDLRDTLPEGQHRLKVADDPGQVYEFGFDLRATPQEDARQYLPFLDYLQQATGYRFKLSFTPVGESIIDRLGKNQVQFAALGSTSFIISQQKYATVILARGINHEGKASYRSALVSRPNSKITSLRQLVGKRLAFGSQTSTQGHLIPRIMLTEAGVRLDQLASVEYTGSHHNCANAVTANKADVCGMQDTMAQAMQTEGMLRIFQMSNEFPSSGIAASAQLPKEVIAKVKQALLDFDPQGKHATSLRDWDKTEMPRGFTHASAEDYQTLKDWMIRLGFIKAP